MPVWELGWRTPRDARPSDVLQPGEHFDLTLSVPGVYDYFCAPHEQAGMVGRLVVGAPTGPGGMRSTGSRVALRPGTGWLFLLRRGRCFPRSFVRNFSFIGRQFRLHRTFTSCCARAASDVLTAKRSRT
jgi:hypothetical protein